MVLKVAPALIRLCFRALSCPIVVPRNIYAGLRCSFEKNTDSVVIRDLRTSGFHIFDNGLDADTVTLLREDFLANVDDTLVIESNGQATGRHTVVGRQLSPTTAPLEERFEKIASAYFSTAHVVPELSYYQYSKPEKDLSDVPGGGFHVDDHKPNIKFFVYITDTVLDNGAFSYCAKTHGIWGWRRIIHWWVHHILPLRFFHYGAKGFFFPRQNLDEIATAIEGKAGTVFVADTTGFHKANPVIEGYRQVFVASYRIRKLKYFE